MGFKYGRVEEALASMEMNINGLTVYSTRYLIWTAYDIVWFFLLTKPVYFCRKRASWVRSFRVCIDAAFPTLTDA